MRSIFRTSGGHQFWIDYHLCVILLPPTPSSFSVPLFGGLQNGRHLDKGTPLYGFLIKPSYGLRAGRGTSDTTPPDFGSGGSILGVVSQLGVDFGGPETKIQDVQGPIANLWTLRW